MIPVEHIANMNRHAKKDPLGCVLYDENCPFCRTIMSSLGNTLREHGFDIAPLQSPWVIQRLNLPEEELLRGVRLLLPDGRQIIGPDVYRFIMRKIYWTYPLYFFSLIPPLRNIFDMACREIAKNRYCIASAAGRHSRL